MSDSFPEQSAGQHFRGWWIVAGAFVTFGVAVGIPYYNLPFFYDYFQSTFRWTLEQITLGFPVAALLTIWAGPLLIPRLSPRKLLITGTGLTAIAFIGFSFMKGALVAYFLLYLVYTVGYIFSGPIPHQLLVSYWFQKKRGMAMGMVYVGVGLFGGLGSFFVHSLTEHLGFRSALLGIGLLMFVTWPISWFLLRDKPSELGQFPDGAHQPPSEGSLPSETLFSLLRSRPFWLLLFGSFCSIGSIGSINTHMKFVFRDAGFANQQVLNATWTAASVCILWSSIAGRLGIGYLADRFSKKRVMTMTYFVVALTILLLLTVKPEHGASVYGFAVIFGFAMGADYMLIPLMAAEQFGINSLPRAMALLLPLNTISQTWCPLFVSFFRQHYGSYRVPMGMVFALAMLGALSISFMPQLGESSSPLPLAKAASPNRIQ